MKGCLKKKIVKKKRKKKRVKKKQFCAKNLPNVLKNRVLGRKKTLIKQKKTLIGSKTLIPFFYSRQFKNVITSMLF